MLDLTLNECDVVAQESKTNESICSFDVMRSFWSQWASCVVIKSKISVWNEPTIGILRINPIKAKLCENPSAVMWTTSGRNFRRVL